ncbi:reductive dehalogenase [Ferrimonas sediminum]|uniref:Reductive dehalogenase n=1 Tax=Ferrimonas sediminum TaxID=718193 RepID=A0A1G8JKF2_9GAMM|nr:reductive dehalogenase [Ferrimonas sediminum]SDI31754.1 reductive dehalogenase [Ferrimonas sediminum]
MTDHTDMTTDLPSDPSRRRLFKYSAAAAGVAVAVGAGSWIKKRIEGIPVAGDYPVPVDDAVLKPFNQRNWIFAQAGSKKNWADFPERDQAFAKLIGENWSFRDGLKKIFSAGTPQTWIENKPGYTQLDWALGLAAQRPLDVLGKAAKYGQPNAPGMMSWEQKNLMENQWQFESKQQAAQYIKRAAKLFGADRCGITYNDHRFNYDPMYDIMRDQEISWDGLGFKPKTVIVLLHEMDYDAIRTAPSLPSIGTVNKAYVDMAVQAGQLADFIRRLGYKAVASHNDMINKVAYGMKAGLGEAARNGALVAPGLGPRVRISAVITELDFVEYDVPRRFGIQEFCEHCKLCADACPGKAITHDDKPSFTPTFEGADDPALNWHGHKGIYKFHNDAKKCFKFWADNGIGCAQCIKTCPWNKPDFWHHRIIDASNTFTGGEIHSFMREMDSLFGYGNMEIEKANLLFWNKEV